MFPGVIFVVIKQSGVKMMRRFLLFMVFMAAMVPVAGKGYKIVVKLAAAPSAQVFLAGYYGSNIYLKDTTLTDATGRGVFERDTLLPQGLYKIYLDQERHFDFLLGADQTLTLTNTGFSLEGLTVEGAVESGEFLDYMRWLRDRQKELANLDTLLSRAEGMEKDSISSQIRALSASVSTYWKRKSDQYPGTMLAAFLMANYTEELRPEDIPAAYTTNDSLRWVYEYTYRKNHFFDHLDLSDERLLNTPLLKSRLDTYLEKVLLQLYDSVKPAAYALIQRASGHPQTYRYVTSHLLNAALASRVMGMDALFVDIARDYYLSGKAAWADSTTLAKIRENVIFLEHNLIGQQARDVRMETLDGQPFRLYQQNHLYTILVFYEPNCSHCNEFVPRLYQEVYLPFRDKGLEVVAVYTMDQKEAWQAFTEKYHLADWTNVWDPHHLSRFKIIYDTRTTPSVYLLDREKKILAKKFSLEFLKEYLGHHLGGV
jgi:peroxiredoxin